MTEKTIELKTSGKIIGVDFGSEKDKSVISVMQKEPNGNLLLKDSWEFVKQLTQEEVNALPSGTRVLILWTGGNGPYEYLSEKIEEGGPVFIGATPLDFVGMEYPFTLVWLLEKK